MSVKQLSDAQHAIFRQIEGSSDNLFVTGRAGTGKSTLLEYLAWHTSKQLVVAAPTGVAALHVGGQTLHSLFRLPIGVIADSPLEQPTQLRNLLASIQLLVIDEVSMVNADLMDAIDRSLRQARQRPAEAFGGAQLVMFGDPFQLAPVPPGGEEASYFADNYRSTWFFDAHVWRDARLRVVELEEIHRQRDPEFRAMLTAVRHGTVTAEIAGRLNEVGARTPPGDGLITLATRNDAVRRINARGLEKLAGKQLTAEAEINGEFGSRAYPADEVLHLKVGAQVMFLRNDTAPSSPLPRWVNGTIGTVRRITDNVYVEVDGEEHEVAPAVWERYRYTYNKASKELSREVVAEFTQFPLRLAWAITIHKSQGKTYEAAVIDLGARAFAPGQSYVALSRLTSLDGLYLTRPLRPSDIRVDPDVQRFLGGSESAGSA